MVFNNKRLISVLLLFVVLFFAIGTIEAVSATDSSICDVSVSDVDNDISDISLNDMGNINTINNDNSIVGNFSSLKSIIDSKGVGDTIELGCNYTYKEKYDASSCSSGILIDKDLTINGNGFTISGDDSVRAFYISNDANVIVNNLTIANCYIMDNSGAIYLEESTLTLNNCKIIDNLANYNGGGIYSEFSTITLNNCIFDNNIAFINGGGIYNNYSNLTINNCNFTNNMGESGFGAIYNNLANTNNVIINNSHFNFNRGLNYGGSIGIKNGNLKIINCDFLNCVSRNNNPCGGAIYSVNANFSVENTSFVNNTADYGGAICIKDSKNSANTSVNILNCTFKDNIAELNGGAIYVEGSNLIINDSLFYANNATEYGGAISIYEGNLTILTNSNYNTCCNFYNSYSNDAGGAIYAINSILKLNSLNFENNTSPKGGAIYIDKNVTYNIIASRFANNNALGSDVNVNSYGNFLYCWWTINHNTIKELIDSNKVINSTSFNVINSTQMILNGDILKNYGDVTNIAINMSLIYYSKTGINLFKTPYGIDYSLNVDNTNNKTLYNSSEKLYTGSSLKKLSLENSKYYEAVAKVDNQVLSIGIPKFISYINASNLIITAYSTKNLVITLYNEKGVLAGKTVTFLFNGKKYNKITDKYGKASLSITSIYVKTYPVTITFAGDNYNLESSKTVNVKINPAYVTVNDIIKAAKVIQSYGLKNKNLPSTVTIGTVKCNMGQASYLMTAAIKVINCKKSTKTKIKVLNEKVTPKEFTVITKVLKNPYLKIVNNIYSKGVKGQLPSYLTANNHKVGFKIYTFGFAKILAFYNNNHRLPNYCVFASNYKIYYS